MSLGGDAMDNERKIPNEKIPNEKTLTYRYAIIAYLKKRKIKKSVPKYVG